MDLIDKDKEQKNKENPTIKSSLIWTRLKIELRGKEIHNKPNSLDFDEYGVIGRNNVSITCEDVFGAKIGRDSNDERVLEFNLKGLAKRSKIYNLSVDAEIEIIKKESKKNDSNKKEKQRSNVKPQKQEPTHPTHFRGVPGDFTKNNGGNSRGKKAENSIKNNKNTSERGKTASGVYTGMLLAGIAYNHAQS